ncbi:MAG: tRNA uridine-5-carboxymethylaminomethyl(34) synthesis GTPase MnmE, partial [Pseudomonadota bacterium]
MTEPVNHVLNQDTIAAIASGSGQSGVGIVRLSGQNALSIGQAITSLNFTPRYAH